MLLIIINVRACKKAFSRLILPNSIIISNFFVFFLFISEKLFIFATSLS